MKLGGKEVIKNWLHIGGIMSKGRGCNECKNKVYSYLTIVNEPNHCGLGYKEAYNKWWEENGDKTEKFSEMDCYEETDLSKLANSANEAIENCLKLFK